MIARRCRAEAGTGTFLALEGAATGDIVLQGNDFGKADTAFTMAKGAKGDVLVVGNLGALSAGGGARVARAALAASVAQPKNTGRKAGTPKAGPAKKAVKRKR